MHLWAVCMPTFSGWNFSLQLNRQIHVPLFLSVPVTTNLPFALFTWHPCQCLVCPACYIPLARWGHTPRPLLNFDISKHLVNMLILSHHCRLAHTADIQDALKEKKMFLKQHCKSNLADVSCHVFGHQSCLVKKPRKEREVDRGGKKKRWDVVYLSIYQHQSGWLYLSMRWIFIYSAETKRKITIILSSQSLGKGSFSYYIRTSESL